MKFSWFAFYCGLLLSISAFSIDILLPSLLAIGQTLDASVERTQLVIPVYMFALGLGHPVYGAMSDRCGRRSGIVLGLSVYLVGALVCLVAGSIESLLIGRFLQGFGAASAPVIARAMMRDRYSGTLLAQNMAVASMFFALGPMIAPLLGFVIYEQLGWRAVFFVLGLMALAMIAVTFKQKETLPPERRKSNSVAFFWVDALAVYQHHQSFFFIIISCFCNTLILIFLTHAPLVYASFGVEPGRFAVLFALSSVGIILGQFVNHYLISSVGSIVATVVGGLVIAFTSFVIWLCAVTGTLDEVVFTILMFTFATSYLIVFSNIISLTLDPHAERAGTASAMFGFTSYVIGSVIAGGITFWTNGNISRWAFCFFLIALIIAAGTIYYMKKSQLEAK